MKHKELLRFATFIMVCAGTVLPLARAEDQTAAQQLSIMDERVSKLRADVDAIQFSQQQIQQDIKSIQSQMEELRHAGPSASVNDLQALESRVQKLDAARETDKKAIIDQLAKELAAMSGSRHTEVTTPPASANGEGSEHVVEKGETLTSIAKTTGVSIADLRKANNLKNDSLQVGQKLVIPQK